MREFIPALADLLAATEDGWSFDLPSRTWAHRRTRLVVRHQFSRTLELTYPDGSRGIVRGVKKGGRDEALDAAVKLVEIAAGLPAKEAS